MKDSVQKLLLSPWPAFFFSFTYIFYEYSRKGKWRINIGVKSKFRKNGSTGKRSNRCDRNSYIVSFDDNFIQWEFAVGEASRKNFCNTWKLMRRVRKYGWFRRKHHNFVERSKMMDIDDVCSIWNSWGILKREDWLSISVEMNLSVTMEHYKRSTCIGFIRGCRNDLSVITRGSLVCENVVCW